MTDQLPRTIPSDPAEQERQMPEWALSEGWKRDPFTSRECPSAAYVREYHPSLFAHALTLWQLMPDPVDPDLRIAREVCSKSSCIGYSHQVAGYLSGKYDDCFSMRVALAAIKRVRALERGEG